MDEKYTKDVLATAKAVALKIFSYTNYDSHSTNLQSNNDSLTKDALLKIMIGARDYLSNLAPYTEIELPKIINGLNLANFKNKDLAATLSYKRKYALHIISQIVPLISQLPSNNVALHWNNDPLILTYRQNLKKETSDIVEMLLDMQNQLNRMHFRI